MRVTIGVGFENLPQIWDRLENELGVRNVDFGSYPLAQSAFGSSSLR